MQEIAFPVTSYRLMFYFRMTPQGVTQDIVGWLVAQQKMKINAEITASGEKYEIQKYVVANKDKLSNTANLICEQYKVYSMLF